MSKLFASNMNQLLKSNTISRVKDSKMIKKSQLILPSLTLYLLRSKPQTILESNGMKNWNLLISFGKVTQSHKEVNTKMVKKEPLLNYLDGPIKISWKSVHL